MLKISVKAVDQVGNPLNATFEVLLLPRVELVVSKKGRQNKMLAISAQN